MHHLVKKQFIQKETGQPWTVQVMGPKLPALCALKIHRQKIKRYLALLDGLLILGLLAPNLNRVKVTHRNISLTRVRKYERAAIN
jgi:hypothetical protein